MADLASFQAQANSIYDPQAAAEKATLTTNYNSGKAASELSKTDANTNYDRALRGVDQNEKTSVDNLNNLYSQRLGGQFSGLQGNALQGLYGKDNQARADLSQNRISMLAKITGQQTAATNKYNTDNSNVDAKFTGEKNKYAGESYNAALKQEEAQRRDEERIQQENQRQANSDRQFALSEARANASESRANRNSSNAESKLYKVNKFQSGNYDFKGPNNESVSLADFISGSGGDAGSLKNILANGSKYDKGAYQQIQTLQNDDQIKAALIAYDQKNYYGYR